jgi:hypothetical protein
MKLNMGSTDRIVRTIIAVLLAVLYFSGIVTGTMAIVLLVISAVFLLTSLAGSCPLYTLFRINTCPRKTK